VDTLDCTLKPAGRSRYAGGVGGEDLGERYHVEVAAPPQPGRRWEWCVWVAGPFRTGRGAVCVDRPQDRDAAGLTAEERAWRWVLADDRLPPGGREAVGHRLAELALLKAAGGLQFATHPESR
jgi:hypothetical protein